MPFKINIQNKKLEALQQENYLLLVKVDGDALPNKVSIKIGTIVYEMTKKGKNTFEYLFTNLLCNQSFQFIASDYTTKPYELFVLPKPSIVSFEIELIYPKYTGKSKETIKNIGDLSIPEGTAVKWTFHTKDANLLRMKINAQEKKIIKKDENTFTYSENLMNSAQYSLMTSNAYLKNNDSVFYSINVIANQSPDIDVQEFKDSTNIYSLFYNGEVSDDYGLNKISFNYEIITADSNK
jgi:hypothetical protein